MTFYLRLRNLVGGLFQLASFSCSLLQLNVFQSCILNERLNSLSRISLCAFPQSKQSVDYEQFRARYIKLQQTIFEFEMYQRRARQMETSRVYYDDLFANDVSLERNTKEPNWKQISDDQFQ